MATFDKESGLWLEFRRFVTGRGATPEDARIAADKADAALKAQVKSAPPAKRLRYSALNGVLEVVEK